MKMVIHNDLSHHVSHRISIYHLSFSFSFPLSVFFFIFFFIHSFINPSINHSSPIHFLPTNGFTFGQTPPRRHGSGLPGAAARRGGVFASCGAGGRRLFRLFFSPFLRETNRKQPKKSMVLLDTYLKPVENINC